MFLRLNTVDAHAFDDLNIVRGMQALEADDPNAALHYLLPAANIDTPLQTVDDDVITARIFAARASLRLQQANQALVLLKDLDAPLALVPDLLACLRARAFVQMSAWPQAQTAWQEVVKSSSSPWHAEARFGLAEAMMQQQQVQPAEHLYQQALRQYPNDPRASQARLTLAQMAYNQDKPKKAAPLLQKIINNRGDALAPVAATLLASHDARTAENPTTLSAQLARIDHLLSAHTLGEADQNLKALESTDRPNQQRDRILQRRAAWAYRSRDYVQATALYEDLMQRMSKKDRNTIERDLANVYAASNQVDKSVALLDATAKSTWRKKRRADAQFRAAWLLYDAGRYQDAETRFETFLEKFPHDTNAKEAQWLRAWSAYHRQDWTPALARLKDLQAKNAQNVWGQRALYWQGRIATLMGNRADAIAAYQQVAERPNTYYGTWSRQRLTEIGADPNIMPWHEGPPVASLTDTTPERSLICTNHADTSLTHTTDNMQPFGNIDAWSDDIFDWSSTNAMRLRWLVRLGYGRQGAYLVNKLPLRNKPDRILISYAQNRLLTSLGDYASAYRNIQSRFDTTLQQTMQANTRPLFHLAYPMAYAPWVKKYAEDYQVDAHFIWAIMRQESGYKDAAYSSASARGLMQIIPTTGRQIAERLEQTDYQDLMLKDPEISIQYGAWYLAELLRKFHGHLSMAIGAYNAGPRVMQDWLSKHPGEDTDAFIEDIGYKETRNYVKQVLSNLSTYQTVYQQKPLQIHATTPTQWLDNVNF